MARKSLSLSMSFCIYEHICCVRLFINLSVSVSKQTHQKKQQQTTTKQAKTTQSKENDKRRAKNKTKKQSQSANRSERTTAIRVPWRAPLSPTQARYLQDFQGIFYRCDSSPTTTTDYLNYNHIFRTTATIFFKDKNWILRNEHPLFCFFFTHELSHIKNKQTKRHRIQAELHNLWKKIPYFIKND